MNRFKRYLSKEIGIEFKACLYFLCFLFFYWCYRLLQGSVEANIVVMAEMIFSTYIMGYIQVFLLRNFDEAEELTGFGIVASTACAGLYTGLSYVTGWFDRNMLATALFFIYLLLCYICVFLVYKLKRDIDTMQLNMELEEFKKTKGEADE